MRVPFIAVVIGTTALLFGSCEEEKSSHAPANRYAWLIGTWTSDFKGNPIIETWEAGKSGILTGSNVVIDTKGDTLLYEPLKIFRQDSTDYLSLHLPGKNGGTELLLPFSASTEKSFNADKVSDTEGLSVQYTVVDKDHLSSTYRSTSKDKPWTQEFKWQRLK